MSDWRAASLHFAQTSPLGRALRTGAQRALQEKNLPTDGGGELMRKALFIFALLISSYIALVFWAETWWQVTLSAFFLSQAIVLVGFNVMHDAGHSSFSKRDWVNRLMGRSLDLIGGSLTLWHVKHSILHHTYTNLAELDDDLETKGVLRLHESQPYRAHHRYQAFYALPLYGLLSIHWILSDFLEFFGERIGRYKPKQRPSTRDTLVFLGFKLNYLVLALGLPLWLHSWSNVLVVALGIQLIVGFTIALVFQLAHVVDVVDMPEVNEGTRRLEDDWATHQLRTTADFAADNRFVSWYCGGLNMQVEHHLFSRISHVRYRHLRPVVESVCKEHGVRYRSYPSVLSAVRGHLRRLSALAQPPHVTASAPEAVAVQLSQSSPN